MDTISPKSRIIVCQGDTETITLGLSHEHRNIGNMSFFVPPSHRSQAWHSVQQRGVCKSGNHDLLVRSGSWKLACSLQK